GLRGAARRTPVGRWPRRTTDSSSASGTPSGPERNTPYAVSRAGGASSEVGCLTTPRRGPLDPRQIHASGPMIRPRWWDPRPSSDGQGTNRRTETGLPTADAAPIVPPPAVEIAPVGDVATKSSPWDAGAGH